MNRTILFTALIAMMLVSVSGFAAAASYSVAWTNSTSNLYQDQNKTVYFNVSNTGNGSVPTNLFLSLSSLGLTNFDQNVTIAENSSYTGSVTITTSDETNVGPHTLSLVVTSLNTSNTGTLTSAQTFSVLFPYCDNVLNMTTNPIRIDEIDNEGDIEGEDYDPLDTIVIKVSVANTDDDDSQTAIVEATLLFENDEVNDADSKVKVKIQEDDVETVKLNLTLPADIKEGTHYIYIRAYNDDDDDNCEQEVIEINVEKATREILPTEVEFPSTLVCGSTFTFSGKLNNVGSNDEDKVNIVLKAFGQVFEDEFSNMDEGDDALFSFELNVPQNATGQGKLVLTTSYDYDEDDNTYDESEAFNYITSVTCKVESVAFKTETSTALVGTESEVRVLLSNPSKTSTTYSLSASADWASISSVTPSSLTLAANSDQYVSVKLKPNADATVGTKNLSFKASYNGATESVNVPVNLQKASTSSSGVLGKVSSQFKSNPVWFTLNAGLVLAIIAVIVLLVSGRKA